MPKIKVKNIPEATDKRICSAYLKCSHSYYYRDVIELSEKDFPTNREWIESLSNEDLAAFYTHGLIIEDYSPYPINIHQMIGSFTASEQGIKDWLSQPCRYLMEEEEKKIMKDKFDQIIEDLKNNK